ncbi:MULTISPECIES: restriction endonuclease [Bacillus]|uniref:restriction endonuclease n=1 Tax=Bacillus TaxID=1386 RepID=UPI0010FC0851|nr:restriction endonuclease [Bacillus velezensis]MEC1699073.1 restriction endonuclease [Bacillus velezensis]QCT31890.1 hypothetical protein D1120_19480 [Bacillus velezensis]QIR32504.1 hypothetical protein BVELS4_01246 [Bacillus velezensis]
MNLSEYTKLADLMAKIETSDNQVDDLFWKPLTEAKDIEAFDNKISVVNDSQSWPRKLNWKKGRVLEDLCEFIFNRFYDVDVKKNKRPGDNETDIETVIGEKPKPPFMQSIIGQKIICECKNKKSTPIDVGNVSKLAEILPTRGSNFGIFISILGITGSGWRYGEGKRKKIMCKHEIPLISFTVKELEVLREGYNFYTMIKNKYNALLDEVDDDTGDIPENTHIEYTKRVSEFLNHLNNCELINQIEFSNLRDRVVKRYGEIFEE